MTVVFMLVAAIVLSWALTGLLVRALTRPEHRAVPNERSMHDRPTPVGGGLAIVLTVLALTLLWAWPISATLLTVLATMTGLTLISWQDHYRPIWPLTRLLAQALAVAICLSLIPDTMRLIPDHLPLWAERVLTATAWLWLINLTNFMDGIDGIAGAQGAAVSFGALAVAAWPLTGAWTGGVAMTDATYLALALAGACLGYLVWNWHPARIFMGDAGSIPIGFLTGWLLLDLAYHGKLAAALILPMVFVADASITLVRRLLAGAKPWHPHRTHFYQRAVSAGNKPPVIVGYIVAADVILAGLAILASQRPRTATIAAVLVTAGLLAIFGSLAAKAGSSNPQSRPNA